MLKRQRRFDFKVLVQLLVGLCLVPCACQPSGRAAPTPGERALQETRGEEARPAYFEMSPGERAAFVSKLAQVRLGETRAEVEKLLGKPTSDESAARKEDGSFLARCVDYYVTVYEKDLVNEKHDEYVGLYFDASDHLILIFSNVKGAERDEGRVVRRPGGS